MKGNILAGDQVLNTKEIYLPQKVKGQGIKDQDRRQKIRDKKRKRNKGKGKGYLPQRD